MRGASVSEPLTPASHPTSTRESSLPASPATAGNGGLVVVAICLLTIVCDGYDLIVYGSVVPSRRRCRY